VPRKPRPLDSTVAPGTVLVPSGQRHVTILVATGGGWPNGSLAPTAPPVGARFSTGEDAALLVGPSSPPPGAVTITAGVDDVATIHFAHPTGTTFWFSPGVHTPGLGSPTAFGQIQAKEGTTWIGAPGAILDGAGVCRTAMSQEVNFPGGNITIKTLEIRNFVTLTEQYLTNPTNSPNWRYEGVHVHDNNNGLNIGSGGLVLHSWLHDNGQYGCATYGVPVNNGLTPGVVGAEVAYSEVDHNGTWQDEWATGGLGPLGSGLPTGNGRNGGMKFWDTSPMHVHHSWVHHNELTGIWADTNNVNMTCEDNYINDNFGSGFMYEISYNFGVRRNTFVRNAIFAAMNKAAYGDDFPFAAVYVSESGGDATVHANWAVAYIGGESPQDGNVFIDNANEVALWENSDRFCNSPNNTSYKLWKPLHTVSGVIASLAQCNVPTPKVLTVTLTAGSPNFTVTGGGTLAPIEATNASPDEGRPVSGVGIPAGAKIWEPTSDETLDQRGVYSTTTGRLSVNATITGSTTMTIAAGSINSEPYYSACRWPTKNVRVKNNLFSIDPAVVLGVYPGVTVAPGIHFGKVALFSQPGSSPAWSPYKTGGPFGPNEIQRRITFDNNNLFEANQYVGPHYFMPYETVVKTFAEWRAAPYNQDPGSTLT
jgi:hypothetical protein